MDQTPAFALADTHKEFRRAVRLMCEDRHARASGVDGCRIVAVGLKERVDAFRHGHIDRGPAEHLSVKVFRGRRIGGREFRPAE